MFRSNPLALVSGLLFLSGVALVWYLLHDFPLSSKGVLAIAYAAGAALAGFWIWQHGQRRARIVEDIPTSKIVSAPQGYVELLGQARQVPDMPLVHGIAGVPCLWYRYRIERRERGGHGNDLAAALLALFVHFPETQEESRAHFLIDDGSGQATVFPHGAEIIAAHRHSWQEGDARIIEERIMPGDTLYVLGDFATHNPSDRRVDLMSEAATQIGIWQSDKAALLRRFDSNRNGVLDSAEWEAMHRAAMQTVQAGHAEQDAAPAVHTLTPPGYGLVYLISSRTPEQLAGHYRFWRGFGLLLFFAGGIAGIWLLGNLAI